MQLQVEKQADNTFSERAGWNREILAKELEELSILLPSETWLRRWEPDIRYEEANVGGRRTAILARSLRKSGFFNGLGEEMNSAAI